MTISVDALIRQVRFPKKLRMIVESSLNMHPDYDEYSMSGGRAGAKTTTVARLLAIHCLKRKVFCVCFREYFKDLAYSSKREIEIALEECGLLHLFKINKAEIICKSNDSRIIFCSLRDQTAESTKSLGRIDIAWLDEARNVTKRSLDILIPTIRKMGSQLFITWNPELETDPVEMFKDPNRDGCIHIPIQYYENEFCTEKTLKQVEKMRKDLDAPTFEWIWNGGYNNNTEAIVFKNWEIQEFDTPANANLVFGADFGFTDAATLVRAFIDDANKRLYIDHADGSEECPIDNLEQMYLQVPESKIWPITADSNRPDLRDYLNRRGFRVYKADKGPGSLYKGVQWLCSYRIIVHPRCIRLIDELKTYSWVLDKYTKRRTGKLKDEKNHWIDALRYACEGAINEKNKNEGDSRDDIVIPVINYGLGRRF